MLFRSENRLPSYFGIARPFIENVVGEANAKGLFSFKVDRGIAPDASDLLSAGVVALMIPDAATRFLPEAPVALEFGGAADVKTSMEMPGGPGGIPIIDFRLSGLKLGLAVAEAPYYDLSLDVCLSLGIGYEPTAKEFQLLFSSMSANVVKGAFAADLKIGRAHV